MRVDLAPMELVAVGGMQTLPSDGYRIVVADERVRAHLERLPDDAARQDCLTRAAEIGIRAIESASQIDFADEVRQSLTRTLEQHSREIAESNAVHRQVLTSLEHASELAEARKKALDEQERLLRELQKAQKGASHAVGTCFEERMLSVLENLAASRGDSIEYTGEKDERDGKAGDIVYTLNTDGGFAKPVQIVVEAKDRECTQSGKKRFYLDELDKAMNNRNCPYGVVVACLEKNQDAQGNPRFPTIQKFPGNRLVVLVDEAFKMPAAMESAVQIIAILAQARTTAPIEDLALEEINVAIDRTATVGQRFRARKEHLTRLSEAVTVLRQDADRDEREYDLSLTDLRRAVQKLQKSPSGPPSTGTAFAEPARAQQPGPVRDGQCGIPASIALGGAATAHQPAEVHQGPSFAPLEWQICPR